MKVNIGNTAHNSGNAPVVISEVNKPITIHYNGQALVLEVDDAGLIATVGDQSAVVINAPEPEPEIEENTEGEPDGATAVPGAAPGEAGATPTPTGPALAPNPGTPPPSA